MGGGSRGVVANTLNYDIVESEFKLQSYYYVHFRVNTLKKGMKSLILPALRYRTNSTTLVLLQG